MTAEAIERAGFTDAPVNGTIAKWMATSVSGIAKAAWVGAFFVDGQDHEDEEGREDRLDDHRLDVVDQRVARERLRAGHRGLARHRQDERGRADAADELRHDVADAGHRVEPSVEDGGDRHRRVVVAAGDRSEDLDRRRTGPARTRRRSHQARVAEYALVDRIAMNPIRKKANVPSSSARSFFVSMMLAASLRVPGPARVPGASPSLAARARPVRRACRARRGRPAVGRPRGPGGLGRIVRGMLRRTAGRAGPRRAVVGRRACSSPPVGSGRARRPRRHRPARASSPSGLGAATLKPLRIRVASAGPSATAADRAADALRRRRPSPTPTAGRPPITLSPALAAQLQKALNRFAAANRLPGVERHDHLAGRAVVDRDDGLRRRQGRVGR